MKKSVGVGLCVIALVVLAGALATAGEVRNSQFAAIVNPDGSVVSDPAGTNNGWSPTGGPGVFIEYPVSDGPPWWNQWFYNDPLDMSRQKWIDYRIVVEPVDVVGGPDIIEVALNWSSPNYPPNPNEPPLVDPGGLIERMPIFRQPVEGTFTLESDQPIWLPFNPEWVSIDIRRWEPMDGPDVIRVSGLIRHQCVPEPATVVLLVLGGLTLALARRR